MSTSTRDHLTDWPDTSNEDPPGDWLYKSATWLLGRHPMLAELAARCPGVVDLEDGELGIELELLAEGLWVFEDWLAAQVDYGRRHPAPEDDARYDAWEAASPQWPDTPTGKVGKAIAPMSGSEKTRLRLLATFCGRGARITVGDFGRMDASGQRLLADWMTAAMAA